MLRKKAPDYRSGSSNKTDWPGRSYNNYGNKLPMLSVVEEGAASDGRRPVIRVVEDTCRTRPSTCPSHASSESDRPPTYMCQTRFPPKNRPQTETLVLLCLLICRRRNCPERLARPDYLRFFSRRIYLLVLIPDCIIHCLSASTCPV